MPLPTCIPSLFHFPQPPVHIMRPSPSFPAPHHSALLTSLSSPGAAVPRTGDASGGFDRSRPYSSSFPTAVPPLKLTGDVKRGRAIEAAVGGRRDGHIRGWVAPPRASGRRHAPPRPAPASVPCSRLGLGLGLGICSNSECLPSPCALASLGGRSLVGRPPCPGCSESDGA